MRKFVPILALALPMAVATCSPAQAPARSIAFTEAVQLWDVLPKPIVGPSPVLPDSISQPARYILYQTLLPALNYDTGRLVVNGYSCTYVDEELDLAGPLIFKPMDRIRSRRPPGISSCRPASGGPSLLWRAGGAMNVSVPDVSQQNDKRWFEVLLDNTRSTHLPGLPSYEPPSLNPLKWLTYPLPMDDPAHFKFHQFRCAGACFYRASFHVASPADLTLDTSQLAHGLLWINGHDAGSFGLKRVVEVPAALLKSGLNEIIVFDMDGDPFATIAVR